MTNSTIPLRAALYLRVSTARQAEHDVSIPDQKRRGEAYCKARSLPVVVHSFSWFFRDHFELEFYVRKLAKNGVKLISITQEMGMRSSSRVLASRR